MTQLNLFPDNLKAKAVRDDKGKLGLESVDMEFVFYLNEVCKFGDAKYSKDNWKAGDDFSVYYNATQRHLDKWKRLREDNDDESGESHLIHAIWNLATLWWWQKHGKGTDDR